MDQPKAVQIIPTDGWRALYRNDEGEAFSCPLVCWVLSDAGGINALDEDLDAAERAENFICYLPPERSYRRERIYDETQDAV